MSVSSETPPPKLDGQVPSPTSPNEQGGLAQSQSHVSVGQNFLSY
jgi:hypothetical protein